LSQNQHLDTDVDLAHNNQLITNLASTMNISNFNK